MAIYESQTRKKLVEITGSYFDFSRHRNNWEKLRDFIPALKHHHQNPLNPKEWAPIIDLNRFRDYQVLFHNLSARTSENVKRVKKYLLENNLKAYLHGSILEKMIYQERRKDEEKIPKDIDIVAVGKDKDAYKVAENIKLYFYKQRTYKSAMQLEQNLQGIKKILIQKIFLKNNSKFLEEFELKNPEEHKYGINDVQKSSYGCAENVTARYFLKKSWLDLNPIDLAIMTKKQFHKAKNIGVIVD